MKELETLAELVNTYYKSQDRDGTTLIQLQKKISGLLYYLTTVEIMAKEQYNELLAAKLRDKVNVTKAVREVDFEFPEWYKLKQIITAAYRVVDSINSQLIYLQSEKKYNYFEK